MHTNEQYELLTGIGNPMWQSVLRTSVLVCLLVVGRTPVSGGVTKIEIRKRLPYAEGRSFEGVGAYQRLLGRVHFAVDPSLEANRRIVDLKLAPVNGSGLVEFQADCEILAPVDLSRAHGTLLYDVNNRGNRMVLNFFNTGADDFLMRHGYIVVWSGWIAELLPGKDRLRLEVPTALSHPPSPVARGIAGAGHPLKGTVRAEMVPDEPTDRLNITGREGHGSYPPTSDGLKTATLTWRLRESDPRVPIPRNQWRLESTPVSVAGELRSLPKVELVLPSGFQAGYIYELIYEAEGSVIQGLGLAGIRDLVSFLKYDSTPGNPLRRADGTSAAERTIGWGISQSGRCLRMLLYDGFNADESGRIVFDGLIPHVAGGGLGFFNHRFASPTRYNSQHADHLYPCDVFPFTYSPEDDPYSDRVEGILDRARESHTVPKVMHVQTSAEYWHRSGSLVHTDPLGERDADIPADVRIYAIGGAQHGAGDDVPREAGGGQLPSNPTDYRPFLRGLLTALDVWIRNGTEPPPSRYPHIADGTLVDWRVTESGWQALPGIRYPEVIQQPASRDYGIDFLQTRFITQHPPVDRGAYRVLAPAFGPDNNERGMLLLPSVAVPVATFTGWNLRSRRIGAANELLKLQGAYIPFPQTTAEKQSTGDPRPALLERYRDFDDYFTQYEAAVRKLVKQRYLLAEDVPLLLNRARDRRRLFVTSSTE